jgi:hypothetical protein
MKLMNRLRNRFKFATWKVVTTTAVLGSIAIGSSYVYFKDGMLSASAQLISQATKQQSAANEPKMQIVGAADGIAWGTATIDDSPKSGFLQYSVAKVGATGFFYGNYKDDRFTETYFANLAKTSPCSADSPGYNGFKSIADVKDTSSLNYSTTKSILVGDKESGCYTGLIALRQEVPGAKGEYVYMVIEPVDVNNTSIKIRWWTNLQSNVTDFSKAPKDF